METMTELDRANYELNMARARWHATVRMFNLMEAEKNCARSHLDRACQNWDKAFFEQEKRKSPIESST